MITSQVFPLIVQYSEEIYWKGYSGLARRAGEGLTVMGYSRLSLSVPSRTFWIETACSPSLCIIAGITQNRIGASLISGCTDDRNPVLQRDKQSGPKWLVPGTWITVNLNYSVLSTTESRRGLLMSARLPLNTPINCLWLVAMTNVGQPRT